ncbi:hypothetical protein EI94DRAFT_1732424 [Lactarius quietus]|nr:hypothetical protein EI94DRAFT_1732424 [Lactarius quietus]
MAPVETEYYDLLGVPVDVNDTDLKKAYRKAAMRYHPDKNPSPDAEEKFKEMSEAYRVLSDSNLRVVYDKNGKKMVSKEGGSGVEDPASFFANVFGGERFIYYIGEISLMKDMTSVATTMLSEEEKAEAAGNAAPSTSTSTTDPHPIGTAAPPPTTGGGGGGTHIHVPAPSSKRVRPSRLSLRLALSPHIHIRFRTRHCQRERVSTNLPTIRPPKETHEAHARTGEKLMETRTRAETRTRGAPRRATTPTAAWQARMHKEAEDLKLESFGLELLHAIGTVYTGFWSKLKEKGAVAKDAWGVIGSALSVQQVMQDIERAQLKGDTSEEELKALEIDVTGKIMLASWRGTRFEVVQVLREVVDNVLKEHGVNDQELYISTVADESDEERRELERMVAEAAKPKKKQAPPSAATQAALNRAHEGRHVHVNGQTPPATNA